LDANEALPALMGTGFLSSWLWDMEDAVESMYCVVIVLVFEGIFLSLSSGSEDESPLAGEEAAPLSPLEAFSVTEAAGLRFWPLSLFVVGCAYDSSVIGQIILMVARSGSFSGVGISLRPSRYSGMYLQRCGMKRRKHCKTIKTVC